MMNQDKTEERAAFAAWFDGFRHGRKTERDVAHDAFKAGAEWKARAALSSAPAQPVRGPMTDAQIEALDFVGRGVISVRDMVRIVERHHGITKE